MNTADLMMDKTVFKATNGKDYYFIGLIKPNKVHAWEDASINFGDCFLRERLLDIHEVGVDGAKTLGIWEGLSPELQKDLENGRVIEKKSEQQEKHDRQDKQEEHREKARLEREEKRKAYANYPTEVVCACGTKTKLNPSQLCKHLETKGISIEDYVNNYKCRKCSGCHLKGRVGTGKSTPTDLVCKCGHKVTYPKSLVIKMAEKKGMTMENFISGYRCQTCNPTKGRHKKS